jgi:membrane fusion protein (multidrug efflux system)
MKRKTRLTVAFAIAIVALVIVFGGSFGFKHFFVGYMISKALANYQPPPEVVSATKSKTVRWRPYLQAIGTLSAINGVNISNDLAGKVMKISFHSGDKVKQGDLLVQLDTSQEQAQLAQYESQLALNKVAYRRQRTLRKKGLNSKQALDTAEANYKSSQAQVKAEQATIAKMSIKAPFTGRLGIRQVNLGQYLASGTTIVTLSQLKPLYVTFTLPQSDVPKLHLAQEIAVDVDAYPNHDFAGKVTAISPAVSEQSRTLQAQATIPNGQELLHPGMFANIKVLADQTQQKVVVPQTAISYSLYGDTVYVLEPAPPATGQGKAAASTERNAKGKAKANGSKGARPAGKGQTVYVTKQVFVKTGAQRGDLIAVTGIKAGVKVVTAGQIKLHPGSRAVVNNSVNLSKKRKLTQ